MAKTNKMILGSLHERVYKKIKLYDDDTRNFIHFMLKHVKYSKLNKAYTVYEWYILDSVDKGFNEERFTRAIECAFSDANIRSLKIEYAMKFIN